jgi:uncharacterized protein (DUF58 family)
MRRRQGMDTVPLSIHHRRLYIVPTRAGVAFAGLLFFMLIAGLNYANSLALLFTFLLAGFAIVAMHECHRNVLRLSLHSVHSAAVFAGHTAEVVMQLHNAANTTRRQLTVSFKEIQASSLTVPAQARATLKLDIATQHRGLLPIDRLRLFSTYPFGLFRAWTLIHLPLNVVVYPRPYGLLPLPLDAGQRLGVTAQLSGGSDEWLGLRAFRDGDSPRKVAWKAYARGAPLLVKEYGAAGARLQLFSLQQVAHLPLEAQLEQLARWVVDAEAQNEHYGLLLGAQQFSFDRGALHQQRCLQALALYQLPSQT